MKYMVMESHLSYAVVLDEGGRFLKVANLHYEVGQTVTDVVEMQVPQTQVGPAKKTSRKWLYSLGAMAACLVLVFTSLFQMGQMPYASVYMTINPEVRIDVNRSDVVVDLNGINADGDLLIENYHYKKKNLDLVMDELVDRAIDMGYLHAGGQITLTLDAEDDEWVVTTGQALETHLNEYLTETLAVTIQIGQPGQAHQGVVTPPQPEPSYNSSDYGQTIVIGSEPVYEDTDYSPNNDGVTDYDDTDYGPNSDGVTDYDDTDYGPNSDGVTDDGQSNYGASNYELSDDDDDDD